MQVPPCSFILLVGWNGEGHYEILGCRTFVSLAAWIAVKEDCSIVQYVYRNKK